VTTRGIEVDMTSRVGVRSAPLAVAACLVLLACGDSVTVDVAVSDAGAGGAPTASGPGAGGRGGAATTTSASGSSSGGGGAGAAAGSGQGAGGTDAAGGSGGAGASGGAPGDPCMVTIGSIKTGSPCDDTGECGSVSSGGCVLCATHGACADAYDAFSSAPDLAEWADCRVACLQASIDTCCLRQCDDQFPQAGAAYIAWHACVYCGQCPHDCAPKPSSPANGGEWGLHCSPGLP
jgi:hypothetical protein